MYGRDTDLIRQTIAEGPVMFRNLPIACLDSCDQTQVKFGEGIGLKVNGIPIGDEVFINKTLENRIEKIRAKIINTQQLLCDCSNQLLQVFVVYCFQPAFNHWLQCIDPRRTKKYAEEFDKLLITVMRETTGLDLHIPNKRNRRPEPFLH